MVPKPGHETPSWTQRRRVIAAVGLSLAVHLVALAIYLMVGVKPSPPPQGGQAEEYVVVMGQGEDLVPPLPATPPVAGDGTPGRPGTGPSQRAPDGAGPIGTRPSGPPASGGGSAADGSDRRPRPPRRPRLAQSPQTPDAGSADHADSAGPRTGAAKAPGPATGARPDAGSAPLAAAPPEPTAPPPTAEERAAEAARAAFRAQLRRKLRETWRAYDVYRRIDPQNRLAGSLFTTVTTVRLSAAGKIESAKLTTSSGVPEIDKQAMVALEQVGPLPAVPREMIDDKGGLTINCSFSLDVGMFLFGAKLRQSLEPLWKPSLAYQRTADQERRTVLRLEMTREGKLLSTSVVASAGIDFLDESVVKAVQAGAQLPVPPPAFTRGPGLARAFVAFLHLAGEIRPVYPREEIEDP